MQGIFKVYLHNNTSYRSSAQQDETKIKKKIERINIFQKD